MHGNGPSPGQVGTSGMASKLLLQGALGQLQAVALMDCMGGFRPRASA